ncbi:MAG: DUF167 domain-containing protein [Bacteroidota bacterium]
MHLRIKVKPNSHENKLLRLPDGSLQVSVRAQPVEGKANAEVILFLSKLLGLPKSGISIEAGEGSKFKKVWIDHPEPEVLALIAEKTNAGPS